MSRGLRLLGALALACATLPVMAAPAHAETAVIVPSNSAYFYAQGVDKPDQSPADPPNVGADADGVSPGHLAVAAKAGMEDKVSFLYFDMFALPFDAIIDKAVVSMLLVPTTPPNDITFNATPANVVACMAGDSGFSGDDGDGIAKAPKRLCDKFKAPAKLSADTKAYEFDITSLANGWMTGANDGVAFTVADTAPSTNFQVVFDTGPTAALSLSYTVPASEDPDVPVVTLPDETGGVITPPTDFGGGGGVAPPPATSFDPGTVVQPPTTTVVAPPVTTPPTTNVRPVAALSTSMRPTNAFWLGGLALAIALALISLICGDPRAAAGQQRHSRLTKALSTRRTLIARPASW